MSSNEPVRVESADFESLGQKLDDLHSTLSAGEANVFEFLMESAALGAGQAPPPSWLTPSFKYKPRGGKQLVAGGADGLTILVTARGQIIVVPPEGPLPTDRPTDLLGAIPIRGSESPVV